MGSSPRIPSIKLNHGGASMPVLGLGMAPYPPVPDEVTKTAVIDAVEVGYRHFDTATIYFTEKALGEGISEVLTRGMIKSREELFITSKLWVSDAHPSLVLPALKTTLQNMKLEYLDLYLIHWPVSAKAGPPAYPIKKEDFLPFDLKGVWTAMEECQRLGLTEAIGVSNFTLIKLQQLMAFASIPPAVNQVALRWAYEQDIAIVVKSFNKDRMKQNLEIFNWKLSVMDDHKKIRSSIPQGRTCDGSDYISPLGPICTIEELWDGDL